MILRFETVQVFPGLLCISGHPLRPENLSPVKTLETLGHGGNSVVVCPIQKAQLCTKIICERLKREKRSLFVARLIQWNELYYTLRRTAEDSL